MSENRIVPEPSEIKLPERSVHGKPKEPQREDTLQHLQDYLRRRTPALDHVAFHHAYETVVCIGIHEDLQVHLLAHPGLPQRHNTLHDDHLFRLDMNRLLLARARDVRINRLLDRLTLFEHLDMLAEQRPVKGIGVVEIDILPFLYRHIATVLVVRILRNNYHFAFRKTLDQFLDYRCFTRAGTARNADDKHKPIYDLTIYDLRMISECKDTTILAYMQIFAAINIFFSKNLAYSKYL